MKKNRVSPVTTPDSAPTKPQPTRRQNLLVFVSQRLLTEQGSATVPSLSLSVSTELLTVSATMMTGAVTENSGYSHYGIND